VTWDPDGIVVGDAFRSYVDRLRDTWSGDSELAANRGVPAGKRHFT